MKKRIAIIMVVIVMALTLTTPALAKNLLGGHNAHIENGELWVDGKAVGNVTNPYGDVDDTPVIVYDPDSSISTWAAMTDSFAELVVAVCEQGGYAVLVAPTKNIAWIGEYDPEERFFGYYVVDEIEF